MLATDRQLTGGYITQSITQTTDELPVARAAIGLQPPSVSTVHI